MISDRIMNNSFLNEISLLLNELIIKILNSLIFNDDDTFVRLVHYLFESVLNDEIMSDLFPCYLVEVKCKSSR